MKKTITASILFIISIISGYSQVNYSQEFGKVTQYEISMSQLYIFSIKFTDCLDFDLSVLIKTSIFINYQNIRYHE